MSWTPIADNKKVPNEGEEVLVICCRQVVRSATYKNGEFFVNGEMVLITHWQDK